MTKVAFALLIALTVPVTGCVSPPADTPGRAPEAVSESFTFDLVLRHGVGLSGRYSYDAGVANINLSRVAVVNATILMEWDARVPTAEELKLEFWRDFARNLAAAEGGSPLGLELPSEIFTAEDGRYWASPAPSEETTIAVDQPVRLTLHVTYAPGSPPVDGA